MTAFARSFACLLSLTAIVAACASSYLDQTSALVTMVRIYAYAAGGLGGLLIILTLPRLATQAPAVPPAENSVDARRVAHAVRSAAPVVPLTARQCLKPAAAAEAPEALRARSRRLFVSAP